MMTLDQITSLFELIKDEPSIRVIDAPSEDKFIAKLIHRVSQYHLEDELWEFVANYFKMSVSDLYTLPSHTAIDMLKQMFRKEEYYKFRQFIWSNHGTRPT